MLDTRRVRRQRQDRLGPSTLVAGSACFAADSPPCPTNGTLRARFISMYHIRSAQLLLRPRTCGISPSTWHRPSRAPSLLAAQLPARWRHTNGRPNQRHSSPPQSHQSPGRSPPGRQQEPSEPLVAQIVDDLGRLTEEQRLSLFGQNGKPPRVNYLRPAIFAIVVSGGIFAFSAFLQAYSERKPPARRNRYRAPVREGSLPSPTELATNLLADMDPISKVSSSIIAACAAVHLSKFIVPDVWISLWHMPAKNLNYTLFTSTFVHSGIWHLGFNMWGKMFQILWKAIN